MSWPQLKRGGGGRGQATPFFTFQNEYSPTFKELRYLAKAYFYVIFLWFGSFFEPISSN